MSIRPRRDGVPGRPAPDRDLLDRAVPLAAAACCLLALPFALLVLRDAWRTREIVAALDDPAGRTRGALLERYADVPPARLSSDAAAALAALAITAAGDARGGLRHLYLDEATALVTRVRTARPGWAIGDILTARWRIARSGGAISPGAIRAFAASYRHGPFLWREGEWRIAFAALCWSALDAPTRAAVIDEAVWLVRYDGGRRAAIERLLGASPAAVSFQLRLARPARDGFSGERGGAETQRAPPA